MKPIHSANSIFLTKRIVLCSFICICFQHTSLAQVPLIGAAINPLGKKKGNIMRAYMGGKFGTNFSYLSGKTWENGVRTNLLAGGFAGIKGIGFGIQGELLFEQSEYTTGSSFYSIYKSHYNNLSDSLTKGSFRLNKLCLPILLQFRVSRLFWLQTGLQFYGIVSVRDFNGLLNESERIFKGGNTAGIIGTTIHIGNIDLGGRMIFDFNNLNKTVSTDVWKQYLFQVHIGFKVF
jgi:hypothetical protein